MCLQNLVENVFSLSGVQERIEFPDLLLTGGLRPHITVAFLGDDLLLKEKIQDGVHVSHSLDELCPLSVDKVSC